MAKNQSQVLEALGLTSESTVEDLINKLKEYAVVSESEILDVKNISVKTLPTVVVNDEKTVKEKMFGIVTNENKGAVALMNKRNALIHKIIEMLQSELEQAKDDIRDNKYFLEALETKVENFTDLGNVGNNIADEENETLNAVTENGFYTFITITRRGEIKRYIMIVSKTISGHNQYIYCDPCGEVIIRKIADSGTITITTKTGADTDYVDATKQSILGDVSPEYSTLENIGNAIDSQQLTIDMNYEELSESIYQTNQNVTNLQNTKADISYVDEGFKQIGRVKDLGTFDSTFSMTSSNSQLNETKESGIYIFSHKNSSTRFYFMIVENRENGTIRQTIFKGYDGSAKTYNFLVRTLDSGKWTTTTFNLPNTEYVDKYITDIYSKLTFKADKTYVNELLSSFPKFSIEVVAELPTENISNTTVYLVKGTGGTEDDFAEYIYVNEEWELLGHAKVELKNYYLKTETEANFVSKKSSNNNSIYSNNTFYVTPKSLMIPTENEHLVNKKYVDETVANAGGGVNADEVLEIIESNSEEADTLKIGTSTNYDVTSDNEIPTTKAVASMIGASSGSGGGLQYICRCEPLQNALGEGETSFKLSNPLEDGFYIIKLHISCYLDGEHVGLFTVQVENQIIRASSSSKIVSLEPIYDSFVFECVASNFIYDQSIIVFFNIEDLSSPMNFNIHDFIENSSYIEIYKL